MPCGASPVRRTNAVSRWACISAISLIAEGEGLSKQDAEIEAAKNALRKYGK